MKTTPILFSTSMVQSILEGRKTQTRRLFKNPFDTFEEFINKSVVEYTCGDPRKYMPYGLSGDILWARETWQHTKCLNINQEDENYGYVYKADAQPWKDIEGWTWKPSIFMPKEACRIFLKITSIKVEKLNNISEQDAIDEGIEIIGEHYWQQPPSKEKNYVKPIYKNYLARKNPRTLFVPHCNNPVDSYKTLWEKINGP